MIKPQKAFVLAAGFGTRLQPHTLTIPKPLVSVAGKPLLDHIFDHLVTAGVTQVTVNTHYLGKIIHKFVQTRTQPDILISHEVELLNTGGGIKKALHHFGREPFYVINGDAFWTGGSTHTPILDQLAANWNPDIMDILMVLQPVSTMKLTQGVGDYDLNDQGQAIRSLSQSGAYMFTSIRINHPRIFDHTPGGAFSYLELLDKAQEEGRLYGIIHQDDWHHISTAEDLNAVDAALMK
jgi:MurNAc alpha-1-phosphate uridylyltransferase